MFDLVVIASTTDPIRKRIQEIGSDFGYSIGQFESPETFMDDEMAIKAGFIVCSTTQVKNKNEFAGMAQVIRQFATEAFLVMVVDSKMSPEDAQFLKKSGANLILLEIDAINSAKIDLIASQKIKYKYLPVKVSEFSANTLVSCDIFHLMPLNKKYLKIVNKNSVVSGEKLAKLSTVNEIYIRKDDVKQFETYLKDNHDETAQGAASRCRSQLLNLTVTYIELILMILDQSEFTSYSLGKELYEKCQKMAGELLTSLGSVPDPWDIINNTSIGDFGSIERGPAIAAYAGLLSLNSQIGDPAETMVAALLMDVGLLDIEPKIVRKLRNSQKNLFSDDERTDYRNHPTTSIFRILGRKLPVTDKIKQTILGSHESYDGQGFPHGWRTDKILEESMLVQLAQAIDSRSLIKMGQARPNINSVRKLIVENELSNRSKFSLDFIQKVRPFLAPK